VLCVEKGGGDEASLPLEARTLEKLERVIDRQMTNYNTERRHSGLGYRSPAAYLEEQGIHPRVLIVTGPPSGSAAGAQVPPW